MSRMSREDLFREIGEIDEAYVEEAQRAQRSRRIMPRAGKALAAAASLVLCVGAGYLTLQLIQPRGSAGGGMNSASDTNGGVMEAAQEEYGGTAKSTDGTAAGAVSNESSPEQKPQEAALTEATLQQGEPGTGISNAESGSMLAVKEEESRGQEEKGPAAEDTAEQQSCVEDMDKENLMDSALSPGSGAGQLTWEAARTDAAFGRYVDVQVPEGYGFTGASRSESALRVIWNRGMEEIAVTCRQADESVSDWLVDAEKPEEYDLGLYSIPWSDSVPQELHMQVINATFRPEQVTLQIVSARTYQVQEAGDVSGSRTRIGILYGDNVLVEISSKGPSAEEIYALINLEN